MRFFPELGGFVCFACGGGVDRKFQILVWGSVGTELSNFGLGAISATQLQRYSGRPVSTQSVERNPDIAVIRGYPRFPKFESSLSVHPQTKNP